MNFDSARPDSVSRLSLAARSGDVDAVVRLLTDGAAPNANDNRGWTSLHEAAAAGRLEVVQLLLQDARVDAEGRTFDGKTPLILAAEEGHASTVTALLDHGADVDASPPSCRSALIAAAETDNVIVARLLLESGADVNQGFFTGWTPLHFASHHGFVDMARLLLEAGAQLEPVDKDGLTPLFLACQRGSLEIVELIVESGKNLGSLPELINSRSTDGSGASPIFLCAQEGHLECLRLLLDNGADCDISESQGHKLRPLLSSSAAAESALPSVAENQTILPIHSSIEKDRVDCVRLLAKSMLPESFLFSTPTPFHFCVMWDRRECLETLVKDAPVRVNDPELLMPDMVDAEECLSTHRSGELGLGYTHLDLLGTAVYFENAALTRRLLQLGLDPNPKRHNVFPPLLLAIGARERGESLVELLLEFGAHPTIYHPRVKGNLALLSCLHSHRLMMMLISHGADVDGLFHARADPRPFYKFLSVERRTGDDDDVSWSLRRSLEKSSTSEKRAYNLLKFLMPFVFPVPSREWVKYGKLVKPSDWNSLQSWSRWVPPLKRLCRATIRQTLACHNWRRDQGGVAVSYKRAVAGLNLPRFLVDFLVYADEALDVEEASPQANPAEGLVEAVDGRARDGELDLEAMD